MARRARAKVIEASGRQRDMGAIVGRQCRAIAAAMIKESRARLMARGVTWESALEHAQRHFGYAEDYDSEYVEYLRGYASASGQRFEDLFVMFCEGEKGLCTDVAVNGLATSDGSVYSLHTEDWRPADEEHVVIVRGRPRGQPSFVAATLGGFELDCGLNSAGLSFSFNYLYQNDLRVGIPRTFVARRIMASRTVGEAIVAATPMDRGASYNVNLCHSSGEMYCVEGSATDHALIYPRDGYLVHTNHYLEPRMAEYESLLGAPGEKSLANAESTIVRFHRALRLVRNSLGDLDLAGLVQISKDHVNRPGSICRHIDRSVRGDDQWKTVFAAISDPGSGTMHFCRGNPCSGRYVEIPLKK